MSQTWRRDLYKYEVGDKENIPGSMYQGPEDNSTDMFQELKYHYGWSRVKDEGGDKGIGQ